MKNSEAIRKPGIQENRENQLGSGLDIGQLKDKRKGLRTELFRTGVMRLIGLLGSLGLLGPSEIGSPWSSLSHSTGRVAFHPVRLRYGTGGINLLS
jgi:hypothetical protein